MRNLSLKSYLLDTSAMLFVLLARAQRYRFITLAAADAVTNWRKANGTTAQ